MSSSSVETCPRQTHSFLGRYLLNTHLRCLTSNSTLWLSMNAIVLFTISGNRCWIIPEKPSVLEADLILWTLNMSRSLLQVYNKPLLKGSSCIFRHQNSRCPLGVAPADLCPVLASASLERIKLSCVFPTVSFNRFNFSLTAGIRLKVGSGPIAFSGSLQ